MRHDKIDIMGVNLTRIDWEGFRDHIDDATKTRARTTIYYANAHALNLAWQDKNYRNHLNRADVLYCDGYGVKLLASLAGRGAGLERFTAPDWLPVIAPHWAEKGYSVFWVGGSPGAAEKSLAHLQTYAPSLTIAGTHDGYFKKNALVSKQVVDQINESQADILLVSFGPPLQEAWIAQWRSEINASSVIAVGGAVEFLAGNVKRGKPWLTDNGFEWLTRLIREPKRLGPRYIIGLPQVLFRFLVYVLGRQRR